MVVKAYSDIVPALLHDLLSVKGLNKSGYRVKHDIDDMESGVYAVINRKIDPAKSFAFMNEHSSLLYLKIWNLVMNYGIGEWRTLQIRVFGNQSLVLQEWNH
jgi:hypothetical protein